MNPTQCIQYDELYSITCTCNNVPLFKPILKATFHGVQHQWGNISELSGSMEVFINDVDLPNNSAIVVCKMKKHAIFQHPRGDFVLCLSCSVFRERLGASSRMLATIP